MGFILAKSHSISEIDAIVWFIEGHKNNLLSTPTASLKAFSRKWEKIKNFQEISLFLKSQKIPRLSQRAQMALSKWIDGEWPIILSLKIPSPREMLEVQAQGKRYVSWLPDVSGPILGKEDNWEFMLHDLMHAERFFYSPELYQAQVGFFRWLQNQSLNLSGEDWDYLRSDMNTHPLHALQFLKHLLDCKGINQNFNIPHWNIINTNEFSVSPEFFTEEINRFFRTNQFGCSYFSE
jgi:hypothetical protein